MKEHKFSPLRSKSSRKPWPQCPDVLVYQCTHCGKLYQLLDYHVPEVEPRCCNETMHVLCPLDCKEINIHVEYQIVGGYNENAVQVFWDSEEIPEWVLLKTFTGGYMKYVSPQKIPPIVFPLADEDAYVYCDEDPCLKCVFRCKKGFLIYVFFKNKGLVEVPLDQMSAHYKSFI